MVFAIHWHESAMGVHMSSILNPLPTSTSLPSYPSGLSQYTGFECPVSCTELRLVIYFTYGNIHFLKLLVITQIGEQVGWRLNKASSAKWTEYAFICILTNESSVFLSPSSMRNFSLCWEHTLPGSECSYLSGRKQFLQRELCAHSLVPLRCFLTWSLAYNFLKEETNCISHK